MSWLHSSPSRSIQRPNKDRDSPYRERRRSELEEQRIAISFLHFTSQQGETPRDRACNSEIRSLLRNTAHLPAEDECPGLPAKPWHLNKDIFDAAQSGDIFIFFLFFLHFPCTWVLNSIFGSFSTQKLSEL
jgi:hypothetical protein